jgi:hypothetical protein
MVPPYGSLTIPQPTPDPPVLGDALFYSAAGLESIGFGGNLYILYKSEPA